MKFLSLAVLYLFGLVAAQDLSGLPTCAYNCALQGIGGTGCAVTDSACICAASSFLSSVQSCIEAPGGCNASDVQATLQFANTFCGGNIATNSTASGTSSGTSSGTGSATGASMTGSEMPSTSSEPSSESTASASESSSETGSSESSASVASVTSGAFAAPTLAVLGVAQLLGVAGVVVAAL